MLKRESLTKACIWYAEFDHTDFMKMHRRSHRKFETPPQGAPNLKDIRKFPETYRSKVKKKYPLPLG